MTHIKTKNPFLNSQWIRRKKTFKQVNFKNKKDQNTTYQTWKNKTNNKHSILAIKIIRTITIPTQPHPKKCKSAIKNRNIKYKSGIN